MENQGVFFGHSSRLGYDRCAYEDRLADSVAPIIYKLNTQSIANCNACLSTFGPRTSQGSQSYGVSTTFDGIPLSHDLVDVETILSNRNVPMSKCKDGQVNDIDVTKFRLQHATICNDFLDPVSTHLTNPPANYRGSAINRFYDLHKPAQANIFYDWQINTKLEAKDNYMERVPKVLDDSKLRPHAIGGRNPPARASRVDGCY